MRASRCLAKSLSSRAGLAILSCKRDAPDRLLARLLWRSSCEVRPEARIARTLYALVTVLESPGASHVTGALLAADAGSTAI
jgi:hypothetical protein